jgi:Domain of unknown function (DUF4174)
MLIRSKQLTMNILIPFFFIILTNLQKQKTLDINDYEWSNRLICIEAEDKIEAVKQLASFKKSIEENEDRKLLFFVKIANTYFEGMEFTQVAYIKNFPSKLKGHEYTISLIGLDGGVKNQWEERVEASEVYARIDGMPMRLGRLKR